MKSQLSGVCLTAVGIYFDCHRPNSLKAFSCGPIVATPALD